MHGVDSENRDYIIGIDIGSSNVVMSFGVRNDEGVVSVLGVEVQSIEDCVKDGDITNYVGLGNAIAKAKAALEAEVNRKINSAYVGVSGRSVYCVRYEDYVTISDRVGYVTENELRELNARIEMVVPGGGDEIVERIPLRYIIDDRQEVKNPIGAFGSKLSATYLFVMVGKHQIDRVNRAMHRAEIAVSGLCVNPTILPQAILREDESEEGVVVVDIGGDLTDISIVKEGKLWYFSSLPIGASAITNDLYDFLRIPKRDIETVKRKYGSAIADGIEADATVSVKTPTKANKQILQRNIAEIAEERLKDIARFVARELRAAKYSTKLPCGVVLTGGSAYLSNIDKLFARELNMEVRFATLFNGIDEESQSKVLVNAHSVAMGLLVYGAKHNACSTTIPLTLPTPPTQPTQPTQPTPPTQPAEGVKSEETIGLGEKDSKEKDSKEKDTPTPPIHEPENTTPTNPEKLNPNNEAKPKEETTNGGNGTTPTGQGGNEQGENGGRGNKKPGFFARVRNWVEENVFNDDYI